MKKLLYLFTLVFTLIISYTAEAQKFDGLDKSPADIATYPSSYKVSDKQIRIVYSRPQLKGRSISELAPAGKVWRTGANEAVEITFYKDIKIGGELVKAGSYSLFSIPGSKEWTIILNSKLNQWGAYSYDKSTDVVRFKGALSKNKENLEAFSIAFKEGDSNKLVLGWGTTLVSIPFEAVK